MDDGVLAVLIVGAGFSGVAMAIRCREAGIGPLAIIEKADDVGGTWRENTYPGAACDVPSHLYSLSFARRPIGAGSTPGSRKSRATCRMSRPRTGCCR